MTCGVTMILLLWFVKPAHAAILSLRAVMVLNEADHLQEADNAAAAQDLQTKEGFELAPIRIIRRKAFPDASAKGLGVVEYKDPKATHELTTLLAFHYAGLRNKESRI